MRLRYNFQGGQIDTQVDTTSAGSLSLSSPAFANIPAIANPDYMPIILDPDGVNGGAEILWITAHTANTTTVTASTAQEATSGRVHLVDEYWTHGPTVTDLGLIVNLNETQGNYVGGNPAFPFAAIIKCGTNVSTSPITINFSIPFPNGVFTIIVSNGDFGADNTYVGVSGSPTKNGFTATSNNASNQRWNWIAIGW